MADNEILEELTVEHGKRTLVANAFEKIRLLFNVLVHFSSPEESAVKSGIQWLALKGEKDNLTKAKVCKFYLLGDIMAVFSLFEISKSLGSGKNFRVQIEVILACAATLQFFLVIKLSQTV